MKPKEGILVIIDGKVKCADKEKPEAHGFDDDAWQFYHDQLRLWEADCKDVVNVKSSWGKMKLKIGEALYDINDMVRLKPKGQRVLYVPEGDKVRITQLLGGPPNSIK